jgi:hypothetical protein
MRFPVGWGLDRLTPDRTRQGIGQRRTATARAVGAGDHRGRQTRPARTPAPAAAFLNTRSPERCLNQTDAGRAQFFKAGFDQHIIVKARGRGIADVHFGHRIGAPARFMPAR